MDDLELQLVKEAIAGNTDAFQSLVTKFQKKIYNISYRMMGNEEDARDMAQESLVKAFRSINKFRLDAAFETWLYRITTNTCLDELRKNKRKGNLISIDIYKSENCDIPIRELAVDKNGPEVEFLKRERQRVLHNAIKEMSEDYKRVIVLRDIQGFSYDEIAEICGTNIGTIKSRINRGRSMLKEKLLLHRELFKIDDV